MAERYRPRSGTEGATFMTAFCCRCRRDAAFWAGTGDSCPIAANAVCFLADHPDYPPEWIVSENGPTCTAFEADDARLEGPKP